MFEKQAEEYATIPLADGYEKIDFQKKADWQKGAEYGYNICLEEKHYLEKHWRSVEERKSIKWFDAKTSIPLPKKVEIYRYTLEVISDKGDIVCYDYKDKCWKKLVIEDEKVTYVTVEIEKWCNRPTKEIE